MTKREISVTRLGEMVDMISCLAVYEGRAKYKAPKRRMSFDEAMALD